MRVAWYFVYAFIMLKIFCYFHLGSGWCLSLVANIDIMIRPLNAFV